jgi:hypothetical protein
VRREEKRREEKRRKKKVDRIGRAIRFFQTKKYMLFSRAGCLGVTAVIFLG